MAKLQNNNSQDALFYLELAPIPVFITNKNGQYIFVNQTACELLNYTKEEFLLLSISDITADKNEAKSFEKLKKEGEFTTQLELLTKKNIKINVLLKAVKLSDNEYIAFCIDLTDNYKAITEAKEKEELLYKFINNFPGLAYLKDSDLKFVLTNNKVSNFMNETPDNIIGKNSFYLFDKNQAENITKQEKEILNNNQSIAYEIKNTHSSSAKYLYNIKFPITTINKKKYVGGIVMDITQLKQHEKDLERNKKILKRQNEEYIQLIEELRQTNEQLFEAKELARLNENRWLALIRNSNDLIFIINNQFKIEFVNVELDKKTNEFIDKNFISLFDNDNQVALKQAIKEVNLKKSPVIYTTIMHNFIKSDSNNFLWYSIKIIPVLLSDKQINSYIIIASNISEQKRTEELIYESNLRWKSLTTYTDDIIQIIDENLIIKYINKAIPPTTVNEAHGDCALNYIDKNYRDLAEKKILSTLSSGELITFEAKLDKEKFATEIDIWFRIKAFPLRRETKKIEIIIIASNITEAKISEIVLKEAKEKAEESDRLKSAFLANMSHEIRTPMNGIIGFADLLTRKSLNEQKAKYYAEVILNNSKQLMNVVNDILDISLIEAGRLKLEYHKLKVNDLIMEMYALFKQKVVDKAIALKVVKDKNSDCVLTTDRIRLRQILYNLLSNAIKFTHKGTIEFGYEDFDNHIKFFVKDTGIGISKDMHDKIFEQFRQVEYEMTRHYGGTGLGLSISKKIVELLGGTMYLESELNKGSNFYFNIPKKSNQIFSNSKKQNVESTKNKSICKILVADDEEINFLYIEELLSEMQNVQVYHVTNGKEAVEFIEQHPETKIILMDIKMPVMHGFDATKEIRKKNKEIPIFAQTAFASQKDKELAEKSGFDGYFEKPIIVDDFLATIKKFIN